MNERIRELIKQAEKYAEEKSSWRGDNTEWRNEFEGIFKEKFAELIVKECADAADMAQDAGCEYAGDYVAEYMGFGQEEGVTEWRAK